MAALRSKFRSCLRGAAATLAISAHLAALPVSVAATPENDRVWEAVAERLQHRHRALHAVEQRMLRMPGQAYLVAGEQARLHPEYTQDIYNLAEGVMQAYSGGGLLRYRQKYPLNPDGSIAEPKAALVTGELLIGVGTLMGVGAMMAYMSREEKPDYPDDWLPGDHDEQGADKRPRNGSASGLPSERNNSAPARRIGVEAARDLGFTGQGIRVAVIDTGADSRHHEIHHSLREDLSWNYLSRNNDIDDYNGHGTHVLALIVGKKDGYGMYGVAPDATSMSFNLIQPADETGTEQPVSLLKTGDAFRRALDGGADVINNSWGIQRNVRSYSRAALERSGVLGETFTEQLDRLVRDDVIVSWAAGNDRFSDPDVFAALPLLVPEIEGHWVAVVSVDEDNVISDFSNRCGVARDFCLAAPGERILSAYTMDGQDGDTAPEYAWMSGTSMAAPLVSGGVAILKQAFPELTAPQTLQILFDSATDLGEAGVDDIYGHGLMDLEAALAPKGPLLLTSTDNIEGASYRLDDSRIALGGGIGAALHSALSAASVTAIDGYGRGYSVPAASMVASSDPALKMPSFAVSDALLAKGPGFSLETWDGVSDPYGSAHLAEISAEHGMKGSLEWGDASLGFGVVTAADTHAYSMDAEYRSGRAALEVELGHLVEQGSVLGALSTGAFVGDRDRSQTDMLRLGSSWEVDGETSLRMAASFGRTDFAQGDLAVQGNGLLTNAVLFGLDRSSVWTKGDLFSVTAGVPLAAVSGQISMSLPSGRAASQEGKVSTTIDHAVTQVQVETPDRPLDLGLAYQRPLGESERSHLGLGAGWRPETRQGAFELRVNLDF
jgi:subtilase-type serine protease